jgi:hypothetical protein
MVSVLHTIAADAPELSILAAVLKQAVEDGQGGDHEAATWLASDDCRDLLAWLVPEQADVVGVHQALLARLRPRKSWQRRLPFDVD